MMLMIKMMIQINVNSVNIVNNYCVNNFPYSFQIDACNNNTGQETRRDNFGSMKGKWLQKQYKR